jgi:hypothetical protein
MELLSRDAFREGVFKRDNYKCVNCKGPHQDAHHILERRLWPDGGYYLDNGATVCGDCHMLCEQTLLTVEEIREKAGILKALIPPHFYRDVRYDKWGNVYQTNGRRTPGELFYDESVQKVLKPVLDQFDMYVKYPRTYHLPWSPGQTRDDRVIESTDIFKGKEVVVTIKMDGENTTMYHDYIHARSIDSGSHPSRTWIKNFMPQYPITFQSVGACAEKTFTRSIQSLTKIYRRTLRYFQYGKETVVSPGTKLVSTPHYWTWKPSKLYMKESMMKNKLNPYGKTYKNQTKDMW